MTNPLYAEIDHLKAEIAALKDERDGYKNGQMQMQEIAGGLYDSNSKWARENLQLKLLVNQGAITELKRLTAENAVLLASNNSLIERIIKGKL